MGIIRVTLRWTGVYWQSSMYSRNASRDWSAHSGIVFMQVSIVSTIPSLKSYIMYMNLGAF